MQKIKFDARTGPTSYNQDFYSNPWKYSFVHNFKVHYKVSVLQALANKADVTISSNSPQLPSTQQVMEEFNQRMQLGNVTRQKRVRFSAVSYHVSNIEYKESLAFYDPQTAPSAPPTPPPPAPASVPIPPQANQTFGLLFCRNCGAKLLSDSKFCTRCGTTVVI